MTNKYLFVISIFFLISCDDETSNNLTYKEIAYNSLSQTDKESLIVDWQDAKIENGIYRNGQCENEFISDNENRLCFFVNNENISLVEFQKLVAVIFNTTNYYYYWAQ